ncbi:hypothetical protein Acr_24g0012540 [Actinidia rufa]|uniref:Uncharacterized protein n=1 Tax=Actinidia rufa TaxID=165716 RepID=A0A7J0GWY8_9ERIC|nr:hypothetical protein Acr_24g0012540 [Actinidia rufa]
MRFGGGDSARWGFLALTIAILHRVISLNSVSGVCDLSIVDRNKLYNFSLASPILKFPHGVLSEDGFYKVAVNETVVWFQVGSNRSHFISLLYHVNPLINLCDSMIFNHNPPTCIDCKDCGGPSRCGMGCSALMSNKIGGYPVCTTIGRTSNMIIHLIDEKNPHTGVIVKMSNSRPKLNCSLAVSVICDSRGVQGPQALEKVGICDYWCLKLGCPELSMA